jgi:putative ABC transport system permease protein
VLTAGCVAGLLLGGMAAWLVGYVVQQRTGLALAVAIGAPEVLNTVSLVVVASLMALLPAIASFRAPVGDALR